jgi:hypothetical protein
VGSDAVWVEHDEGDLRIIPVSWTSLRPRVTLPGIDGREIRLALETALELAKWVAARRTQE